MANVQDVAREYDGLSTATLVTISFDDALVCYAGT